jgi:hypothetical protein
MKLTITLEVPMGCPHEGCDGTDFYILLSHPWGDSSTYMSVRCEKCQRQFYTNKGVFAAPLRPAMNILLKQISLMEKT